MITFFTDGGGSIGLGHIYRSITLAKNFKKKNIQFLILKKYYNKKKLIDIIFKKNALKVNYINSNNIKMIFNVYTSELIIFDVPKLKLSIMNIAKKYFNKTVIIDDENNLKYYNCDIIINQNSYANKLKYNFKNKNITKLFGHKYTILKSNLNWNNNSKLNKKIKNIFLIFGGTDVKNYYSKFSKKLSNYNLHVNVLNEIIKKKLSKIKNKKNIKIHKNKKIDEILKKNNIDLVISCCGSVLYEIFLYKVPIITVLCVGNQKNAFDFYSEKKAIIRSNVNNIKKNIKDLSLKERVNLVKKASRYSNIYGVKLIKQKLIKFSKNDT